MRRIEFKIKRVGLPWESIPVEMQLVDRTIAPVAIVPLANEIALHLSRVSDAEVRWNEQYSFQGHYVKATLTVDP